MLPVYSPPFTPGFTGQIGVTEILIIIAIALILFGPKKLPELAKAAGEAVRIFREESRKLSEEDTATLRSVQREAAAASSTTVSEEELKKLAKILGVETENRSRDEVIKEIVEKAKQQGLI